MSSGPPLGGGDYYQEYGPRGPYGPWMGCGCSSLLVILAGMLLVCAGVFHMLFEKSQW